MTKRRRSKQNPEVRDFILRNVTDHPDSVASLAIKKFSLSRTAINRYTRQLQKEGLLSASGKTKARRYSLVPIKFGVFTIEVFAGLPEHHIWNIRVLPLLEGLPDNVLGVCRYGFTEILNNVIDHSASAKCRIGVRRTYANVEILIRDFGVGIFEKIRHDLGLTDARSALLELSKGKLTTDKKRHTGEGIYFTSRMFDRFNISSGRLSYTRNRKREDEWLVETGDRNALAIGTRVYLCISTDATWSAGDIFEKYLGDDVGFRRTHVPVKLGLYPNDELVSRSQAKRVLARFEKFSEVFLDFEGVSHIGQPFADEIFRVFANEHPETKIVVVNQNAKIQRVIDHVKSAAQDEALQPELPLPASLPLPGDKAH